MRERRDNEVKRCKRPNCGRATFVETDEGLSADFHHGARNHREEYTVAQMISYLAGKGYVVVEAAKLLKVA